MRKSSVIAGILLYAVLAFVPASADEIELDTGDRLQGRVQGERLAIETPQGQVNIAFEGIEEALLEPEGRVRLRLVDGSRLEGRLLLSEIVLREGLLERVIPVSRLRSVRWSAPAVDVPAGTRVPLHLTRPVSSSTATAGASIWFCVAEPVEIGARTVIEKYAPAAGRVLGSGGGRNVEGGESLVLTAGAVTAIDGSKIPLSGKLQVRGGFDASALAGGALGLLASGSAAVASSGLLLDAQTAEDAAVALRGGEISPEAKEAQAQCRDFYKFQGAPLIRFEEVDPKRTYAPIAQPMRISIPLNELLRAGAYDKNRIAKSFAVRSLVMEDVLLSSLTVEADGKRGGAIELEIEAAIHVRPSHDRWVSLQYDLLADGQKLLLVRESRIDAEEKKVRLVRSRFDVVGERAARVRAADDVRLEVTMTAIDN